MSVLPARQHFGDLLGSDRALSAERALLARFEDPLDRLLLSADGTLQLLISAWHSRVVQVKVVHHVPHDGDLTVDREVDLSFADDRSQTPFCTAKSRLKFTDVELMEKARLFGIGQLFREINQLPRFELLSVERNEDSAELKREYRMAAAGIECLIEETFKTNPLFFEARAPSPEPVSSKGPAGFRSDARLSPVAPPQLTPVQRLFCMANGNVQRISSALLGESVEVRLLHEKVGNEQGEYMRNVELTGEDTKYTVCHAQSHIRIKNASILEEIKQGTIVLGSLIKTLGAYPKFNLTDASWSSPYAFTRSYNLDINNGDVLINVSESFEWPRDSGLGALSIKWSA